MSWLSDLYRTNPTAQAIALLALVSMVGMVLGGIKVRGIGLGNAAVLFAGIGVGAISKPIDHGTLEFVKELGLILFVFCIGLQLGPGFFASLRDAGLRLNALAAGVVVLGGLASVLLGRALSIEPPAVLGLFAGATTNTPSLGAAQQTLASMPGVSDEQAELPALAYAVSYPVAIVGILGTILLLKKMFRVDTRKEAEAMAGKRRRAIEAVQHRTLVVENPNIDGMRIDAIPGIAAIGVLVSRIRRQGQVEVQAALRDTVVRRGDLILAVGTPRKLDQCQAIVGAASTENLVDAPGSVKNRRVVVTSKSALGKTVRQLGLEHRFGVTVTRVTRADLEMTAVPNLRIQFGDVVQVVGSEEGIQRAAERLGNSLKALNETHFVPLFAGIVVGIILGTLPIAIPGIPQPLRLGLAGGPLIVAIIVGRFGRIGPLVWHMPLGANIAFRELGIALFFASVGLMAGPRFFGTLFSANGLWWMAAGAFTTVVPLLVIGVLALAVLKLNFLTVSGLLAGSMTDPPALAFANNISGSEVPNVAYATVYPLTTMLRIAVVQVLATFLCG